MYNFIEINRMAPIILCFLCPSQICLYHGGKANLNFEVCVCVSNDDKHEL